MLRGGHSDVCRREARPSVACTKQQLSHNTIHAYHAHANHIVHARRIADAIYARVPGAMFQNVTGGTHEMWTLPCTTELNVTFIFDGVHIPMHPLDTVTTALRGPPDETGEQTCVGAFQPIVANRNGFDIILGMSFREYPSFGFVLHACPRALTPPRSPERVHADRLW